MRMHMMKPVVRWWSLMDNHLLSHYTETLEIHTDRFVQRSGVLSKRENVVRFTHITNYSSEQNLLDRLFGVANFNIETSAGAQEPEMVLRGYPDQLRSFLSRMLDRFVQLG